MRLYQSLYETALRNNVPQSVIDELVRIYSYDVDFQRKVQPGDSFDVLYSDDENGEGKNEVRFASLTVGGDTKKYYHFQTTDDGTYDYYDETGKSAKKFLVRKPVADRHHDARASAGATIRCCTISELHTGVDWAAPMGTPIFAAGNGTIDEIGAQGRLRQIRPHPPRQRLRDRLRPHDRVRPRPRRRQPRCARARSSASSARPACRPARTCTSKS